MSNIGIMKMNTRKQTNWKKDKSQQDVWLDKERGIRIYGDNILIWDERVSDGDITNLHIRGSYNKLKREVGKLMKLNLKEWNKLL